MFLKLTMCFLLTIPPYYIKMSTIFLTNLDNTRLLNRVTFLFIIGLSPDVDTHLKSTLVN